MAFEIFSTAQYRALDSDALIARRDEIVAELENAESEISTSDMQAEAQRCEDEFARRNAAFQIRSANVAAIAGGAGRIIGRSASPSDEPDGHDPACNTDSAEYRKAFMDYCVRGVQFPMELREGGDGTIFTGVTLSDSNAPQVPKTMQAEIIKAMREYGTIWNEVRKLNVKGGAWFRVLDIIPTATWLTENNVSSEQGIKSDTMITFSFYELECRMAQSLLSAAVTFDDFQAMFVPAVAEAMVTAIEAAIMNGNGTGKPLGILNDPRVTTLNANDPRKAAVVEMTAAEFGNWKKWRSEVKSKIPTKYRTGKWYMNTSSFDCYIETMSDDHNAPVFTDFDAVTGQEIHRLCGFRVETVADAILPDFDSAEVGDVVAIYGDMRNYAVNTQPGMPLSTVRWVDHDTNKEKIKSLVAIDGKVLDPYGFILIKKKASV